MKTFHDIVYIVFMIASIIVVCTGDRQEEEEGKKKIKEILKSGLDDLVNVNSLLSIAVFVGLSYATPGQRSLENRPECDAEPRQAENLVVLEVVAFSFFLFSSLVAKSLKVNFQIYGDGNFEIDEKTGRGRLKWWKWIRLGRVSCKSPYTQGAALLMTVIVCVGMLIYLPLVVAALHKALHLKFKSGERQQQS
ncbi:hypothetical protein HYC85_031533 [Camellia sinensis]|uniref:Uncharacterized protein n=1 Tax=Camellia sinensis TaxID=4442 RepID=A0A7J7FQT6_CAMSI|nr:hypothetical protein HYC85_031533 [Camellia sinensis]